MDDGRITELIDVYRDGLLEDVIPFWLKNGWDREHGGYFTALGRDGAVIDTDKAMWPQGRFAWMLSNLYNMVEAREEWLEAAKSGIEFVRKHGFDSDGRLFFHLTRTGQPIRKRRYNYSESFYAMALAAYARGSGDEQSREEAIRMFDAFIHLNFTPGVMEAKFTNTRPTRGMGPPMIALFAAQQLREHIDYPEATMWIDRFIAEIQTYFVKPDIEAVMETVAPNGDLIDHFDGRLLNPGHAIEAAWFILQEAKYRGGDARLIQLGCSMLDWMWKRGWDREYGGMLYFTDVKNLPVAEYWHDMKFWWPHNETIIASLLAYQLTGNDKYAEWHRMVHDWSYAHFPDEEHGEWYGYLHRDGRISVPLKGNLFKGPFHLPRMQWTCWQILKEMQQA